MREAQRGGGPGGSRGIVGRAEGPGVSSRSILGASERTRSPPFVLVCVARRSDLRITAGNPRPDPRFRSRTLEKPARGGDQGLEPAPRGSLPSRPRGNRHAMARRKVTMLEAFEASAREARQRERSEQRRNAAERRGVVGSLLPPFRGGGDPSGAAEEAPTGAAAGPKGPSLGVGAVPIDRRPPGGSSWEPRSSCRTRAPPKRPSTPQLKSVRPSRRPRARPCPRSRPSLRPPRVLPGPRVPELARRRCRAGRSRRWSRSSWPRSSRSGWGRWGPGRGLRGPAGGRRPPRHPVRATRRRDRRGRVQAHRGDAPRRGVAVGQAAAEDETDLSPAESKFLDESTTVTVMAIAFDDARENDDPAFDAFELLSAEGLPALRPYYAKNRIFVFVGGAGSVGDRRRSPQGQGCQRPRGQLGRFPSRPGGQHRGLPLTTRTRASNGAGRGDSGNSGVPGWRWAGAALTFSPFGNPEPDPHHVDPSQPPRCQHPHR